MRKSIQQRRIDLRPKSQLDVRILIFFSFFLLSDFFFIFCRILSNSADFSGCPLTLSNSSGFSRVLSNYFGVFSEFFGILSVSIGPRMFRISTFGLFRIHSDHFGFSRIPSDPIGFFLIVSNSFGYKFVHSDSIGFSRILSNFLHIVSYFLDSFEFSGLDLSYFIALFSISFGFFWISNFSDSFGFSWIILRFSLFHRIFSDSLRSWIFRILSDSLCFRIFLYSFGFYSEFVRILSEWFEFTRNVSNSCGLVQILSDFHELLLNYLGSSWILLDSIGKIWETMKKSVRVWTNVR